MLTFAKKILKNDYLNSSFWQFLERVFNLLSTFFVSIYLIRYLGPEQYGTWAYAQSYVFLFLSLTTLGLQSIVVSELVKQERSPEEIMGSAFAIMLIGSLVMLILCTSSSYLYQGANLSFWMIMLVVISNTFMSLNIISFYFQSIVKSKYTVIAKLVQDIIDIGGKLLVIVYHLPLLTLGFVIMAETIIMALTLMIIYQSTSHRLKRWRVKYKTCFFLIKKSLPLAISGALIGLYMRLDQVMLEYFKGVNAVGEYSAGVKLVEALYMLPTILCANLLPFFVKKYRENKEEFITSMKLIYSLMFYLPLLLALLIMPFTHSIVHLLFGSKYFIAGTVLEIAIWSNIFVSLGVASNLWIVATSKQRFSVHRTAMGLFINLGLNFYLIPRYGAIGAAMATLAAQFTVCYISLIAIRELRSNAKLMLESLYQFRNYNILKRVLT